ncbi:MAG: hypothetical protein LBS81_03775 [Endomicrobium sp.]|nr:hypothetical protein [Endomicrobium sp.]
MPPLAASAIVSKTTLMDCSNSLGSNLKTIPLELVSKTTRLMSNSLIQTEAKNYKRNSPLSIPGSISFIMSAAETISSLATADCCPSPKKTVSRS